MMTSRFSSGSRFCLRIRLLFGTLSSSADRRLKTNDFWDLQWSWIKTTLISCSQQHNWWVCSSSYICGVFSQIRRFLMVHWNNHILCVVPTSRAKPIWPCVGTKGVLASTCFFVRQLVILASSVDFIFVFEVFYVGLFISLVYWLSLAHWLSLACWFSLAHRLRNRLAFCFTYVRLRLILALYFIYAGLRLSLVFWSVYSNCKFSRLPNNSVFMFSPIFNMGFECFWHSL